MIKTIALTLLTIFAIFLVYVALKSPNYTVSREITINAAPEKIFPVMNNPKLASQWGPWMEIDPQAKMEYSGPEEGIGSKTSWNGGKQLGTGSATIVESVPNQKIGIKLEYTAPMVMNQDSEYLIQPSGNQSIVIWKVYGKNNFVQRLMCSFMDMDKIVGGMFEKGLANLKALVEKQ